MVKRILVVGVNSAGKTSVIAGLADASNHHTIIDDCINSTCFKWIIERDSTSFEFREAPGLGEAVETTADESEKLLCLEQLTVFSKQPIDLVLFITKNGTIHNNAKDMYMLIKTIIPKSIPLICVVTGCENEFDMNRWAKLNKPHFERHGMIFDDMVGACFGRGGRMEPVFVSLREESASDLWKVIHAALLQRKPVREEKCMEQASTRKKSRTISREDTIKPQKTYGFWGSWFGKT